MPEIASQTFDLVGREVNATLAEARAALESYVEQPDNEELLERCAQELHQVQGVLRLLAIYGADARNGAAAELPGARARRRPRSGAGAPAAAQRPARGARQFAALRRHAAGSEPQVRQAGATRGARAGRVADDGRAMGAPPARPLPAGPHRLDPR